MIRLRFLGSPQVERDGEPVQGFRSRKALALLGYLAVEENPVPRSHLAALFWEGMDERRGRANLSWVLNRISRLIPECLAADRHTVRLVRTPTCRLDTDDLLEALHRETDSHALASAVSRYRGAFLDGIGLDGCSEFEIWLAGERERWRRRAARGLDTLTKRYSQAGAYEQALQSSRRLLELEPWRERTHRSVMRLLARCGRHGAAMGQYERCRQLLADELGVEPTRRTKRLYERIRTMRERDRHNLPLQPTPFVGRRQETTEIGQLLENPDCRLLTLLGPGGVGKTRLALEAASAKVDAFLEGVWFIPLASVSSSQFLISTIAEALGVPLSGRTTGQAELLEHMCRQEMVLILDGFEHLVNSSDLLVNILEAAPEIKLLVTSRTALGLRWEWRYTVDGLGYPMNAGTDEPDPREYDAVILFQQVARRIDPHFPSSMCDGRSVARICQLLEGMPLAIELAAAWVRTHTCKRIAREIQEDIGFLTSSLQDVPDRHSSIRAAFERSWRLLTPAEKQTFTVLSVFRRGFDQQGAGEVADASEETLESLVDKSLVRFAPSGRYDIHNLLRQYASDKLRDSPPHYAVARERHAAHYLALLRRLDLNSSQENALGVLAILRPEIANIRAAWRWAARQGWLNEIERSLSSLSRFYLRAGPYRDGETLIRMAVESLQAPSSATPDSKDEDTRHLGRVLASLLAEQARFLNRQGQYDGAIQAARASIGATSGMDDGDRAVLAEAMAHVQWGRALLRQGQYAASETELRRALTLCSQLPPHQVEVDGLRSLGNAHHGMGDYDDASRYYREALSISRELGDRRSESALLANLGLTAHQQGHYGAARAHYESALDLSRAIGDRWSESLAMVNLGYACDQQGAYTEAEGLYRRSLHITQEIGDRQGESMALSCLGLLFHHLGDDRIARGFSEQAVSIAQEIGDPRVQAYALTRLGHSLLELGRIEAAKATYAQAVGLRDDLGERGRILESHAGLARTLVTNAELAQAKARVDMILPQLVASTLNDMDEPLRVYLTCIRVLELSEDTRAASLLEEAHDILQQRAAHIDDEQGRRDFLENVAAHREILRAHQRLQASRRPQPA